MKKSLPWNCFNWIRQAYKGLSYDLKYPYLLDFFLVIIVTNNGYASAWLIEPGQYRYTITLSNIDQHSKAMKRARADLRLAIERQLEELRKQLKLVAKSSAFYKKLFTQISRLERTSQELTAYPEMLSRAFSVEYGISKNQNIGLQFFYKDNQLQGTQYKSKTLSSEEISTFYKIKLFQNNSHIISFQPKLTIAQYDSKRQFSYELLLCSGTSKIKGNVSVFTDKSVAFGQSLPLGREAERYYAVSATKGIKFNNGIMLVNFVKYYIRRKNYNDIYNKTIYNQLSVANHIKFGNLKQNSLIAQIGYFSDKSLVKPNYKVSGVTFSMWIDI